jgi:hypothetical protein
MAINNLPAALQSIIQLGFLEREFRKPLRAKLGFRALADKEPFTAAIGETITKTRTSLLPANTTPMAPAANSDFTSGLTPQNYSVEQYVLGIQQYAGNMMLNVVTSRVAIAEQFLLNAGQLAEQAARSVDMLAQQQLFNAYMGGNTRVLTTLGAAGPTIHVDDIRGFQYDLTPSGAVTAVSSSNPVNVTVGSDVYSLIGAVADATNISTAPGGISGNLTFASNVTVADGTAGNAVIASTAPTIVRPSFGNAPLTSAMAQTTLAINPSNQANNARLTMQMILAAKAQLELNHVPPADGGQYILYADPQHLTGLYQDPAFQYFFRGRPDTPEYRQGIISEQLGVTISWTNLNPVQTVSGVGTVRRAFLGGKGALVEGEFTSQGYRGVNDADLDDDQITMVDGIAHIVREPLDALRQVVTQSWSYIGGFVAPTDYTTNPTTIPTATYAAYKRGAIIESL